MKEDDPDKLEAFKKKISEAFDLAEDIRDAANEDIRFCNVEGGMWEGWLEQTHGYDTNRAKLEFDITTDFVNRYVGEWTLNRANVMFTPDDSATTDDDADLLSGIYRADFKDNDGQLAQDNAVQEVAECGIGHFRLTTEFQDDEDPENENQDVHWQPIYNSYNTVIWDPQGKRVDKADASWCCVLTPYTQAAYKEAYPEISEASVYEPQSRGQLDWIAADLIYVAEYYEIKPVTKTFKVYENIEIGEVRAFEEDDEIPDGWEYVRTRKLKSQEVHKSIFTAVDWIEKPKRIAGKHIPVIPMYGFRKYIDGREWYRGLVRKLKDANRLFNSNVSRLAEASAASGDELPIMTPDQFEGLEAFWANKTNKAFLPINPVTNEDGQEIHQGPVGYLKPPAIDPNTIAATEITSNFVQRTTGNAPQDTIDPDASGKAINALRARENLNTQVMTDNILSSIKHSGKVYLSIANEIYTEMRGKRVLKQDGTSSLQQINVLGLDAKTGQPVETSTLSGKFKVDVEIGPQYESQREATVETMERAMQLVGPESKYFEPLMSMWLKNIVGTGLEEVKEFNRQEMLRMGLAEPETDEEIEMMQALAQEEDPAKSLQMAAAQQQQAEAQNLMASADKNMADAEKKRAETVEILEKVGKDPDGVTRLRYNPQTGQLESANGNRATRAG